MACFQAWQKNIKRAAHQKQLKTLKIAKIYKEEWDYRQSHKYKIVSTNSRLILDLKFTLIQAKYIKTPLRRAKTVPAILDISKMTEGSVLQHLQ